MPIDVSNYAGFEPKLDFDGSNKFFEAKACMPFDLSVLLRNTTV
jgi:hypothetical protein